MQKLTVGLVFRGTFLDDDGIVVDISSATAKKVIFKKPDRTTVEKDAEFDGNGTDGKLKYTTGEGDIDQPGTWQSQYYVELSTNPVVKVYSDIQSFLVHDNLAEIGV